MTLTAPRPSDHTVDGDGFITDLLDRRGPYRAPVLPTVARGVRRRAVALAAASGETGLPLLGPGRLAALVLGCAGPGPVDRQDEALVRVLASTALHHRTVLALRPCDVDLSRGRLTLPLRGQHTPTTVPLGDHTVRALGLHLELVGRGHPVLWPGPWGRPTTVRGLTHALGHLGRRAGVGTVLATSPRRGALDRWLRAGGSAGEFVALHGWCDADALPADVVPSTRARALSRARHVDLDDF